MTIPRAGLLSAIWLGLQPYIASAQQPAATTAVKSELEVSDFLRIELEYVDALNNASYAKFPFLGEQGDDVEYSERDECHFTRHFNVTPNRCKSYPAIHYNAPKTGCFQPCHGDSCVFKCDLDAGHHRDPNDCQAFCHCTGHNAENSLWARCQGTSLWNPKTQTCDWSRSVTCLKNCTLKKYEPPAKAISPVDNTIRAWKWAPNLCLIFKSRNFRRSYRLTFDHCENQIPGVWKHSYRQHQQWEWIHLGGRQDKYHLQSKTLKLRGVRYCAVWKIPGDGTGKFARFTNKMKFHDISLHACTSHKERNRNKSNRRMWWRFDAQYGQIEPFGVPGFCMNNFRALSKTKPLTSNDHPAIEHPPSYNQDLSKGYEYQEHIQHFPVPGGKAWISRCMITNFYDPRDEKARRCPLSFCDEVQADASLACSNETYCVEYNDRHEPVYDGYTMNSVGRLSDNKRQYRCMCKNDTVTPYDAGNNNGDCLLQAYALEITKDPCEKCPCRNDGVCYVREPGIASTESATQWPYYCLCPEGYSGHRCEIGNQCTCDYGTAATGQACTKLNAHICSSCNAYYHPKQWSSGEVHCQPNTCDCTGGITANVCNVNGGDECQSCNTNFHLENSTPGNQCVTNECATCEHGTDVGRNRIYPNSAKTYHECPVHNPIEPACQVCDDYFHLKNGVGTACEINSCVSCSHGTDLGVFTSQEIGSVLAGQQKCKRHNSQNSECTSCDAYYHLDGNGNCVRNRCTTCEWGTNIGIFTDGHRKCVKDHPSKSSCNVCQEYYSKTDDESDGSSVCDKNICQQCEFGADSRLKTSDSNGVPLYWCNNHEPGIQQCGVCNDGYKKFRDTDVSSRCIVDPDYIAPVDWTKTFTWSRRYEAEIGTNISDSELGSLPSWSDGKCVADEYLCGLRAHVKRGGDNPLNMTGLTSPYNDVREDEYYHLMYDDMGITRAEGKCCILQEDSQAGRVIQLGGSPHSVALGIKIGTPSPWQQCDPGEYICGIRLLTQYKTSPWLHKTAQWNGFGTNQTENREYDDSGAVGLYARCCSPNEEPSARSEELVIYDPTVDAESTITGDTRSEEVFCPKNELTCGLSTKSFPFLYPNLDNRSLTLLKMSCCQTWPDNDDGK